MPHSKRTATGVLGGVLGLVGLSAVAGILVTATVTPAIAVSGYAASSAIDLFDNMPSYLEIEELMLPTEIYANDSDGDPYLLAEFYDQNRIPVTYDEVAPVMYDAILSSEDKNYYSHGGVDLMGTFKALYDNATGGDTRGGSTITQQYVKNVIQQSCEMKAVDDAGVQECYKQSIVNSGTEGYQRKLQEMRYAIALEQQYSKDEVLLGYLNIASFGGSVYGIGAAAERYFGVSAADLTIAQAATIAGMVQEPNTFRIDMPDGTYTDKDGVAHNSAEDGYAKTLERRNYVLYRMYVDGKISKDEYTEARESAIVPNVTNRPQGCTTAGNAQWFCDYVVSIIRTDAAFGDDDDPTTYDDNYRTLRRGGLKIYTTLDADLQAAATKAISVVPTTVDYMDLGASGIQVEVGTGRVLSMVQNRGYNPSASDVTAEKIAVNYNVRQQNGGGVGHSAGSTYKVFSLVNWLEQGHSVNEYLNGRVGTKTVETCDGATQQVKTGRVSGGVRNFENNPGYTGTIYNFTRDSLNSGFIAMAGVISVCSTNQVAGKLGVTYGDGTPTTETPSWSTNSPNQPYDVLGSINVAPIDMAQAYASIAANGMLCEAKAIDKVLNADGSEHAIPETTCERVMSEAVASTAAYTLQGVMASGGTGIGARIGDGTPIFGKTGIHEFEQTWMDGSSTEVTTVVWVGNGIGHEDLQYHYASGYALSRIRNSIWPKMQGAANQKYGGDKFPTPDSTLTKRTYVTLPDVTGKSIDDATATLEAEGFSVTVGDAVDSTEAAGTIVSQSPGAGRVAGGTNVTISPSNGQGVTVPAVSGTPSDAQRQLTSAGFSNVSLQCSQSDGAPDQGVVTGTDPAAGSTVSRSTAITINYQASDCDGGRGNGRDG